jgi:hypothetical protein
MDRGIGGATMTDWKEFVIIIKAVCIALMFIIPIAIILFSVVTWLLGF